VCVCLRAYSNLNGYAITAIKLQPTSSTSRMASGGIFRDLISSMFSFLMLPTDLRACVCQKGQLLNTDIQFIACRGGAFQNRGASFDGVFFYGYLENGKISEQLA